MSEEKMKARGMYNMRNRKIYKVFSSVNISSFRTASMIPGDREVAGCLYFSKNFQEVCQWKTH